MNPKHLSTTMAAFFLGACATAAVQSTASTPTIDMKPTIVRLADAPRAATPSGSARIQHLARGSNAYVGRLELDAGGKVPVHRDATEEFIHIVEGSGTITIEGTASTVSAGDTIYMPAGVQVSFTNGDTKMVGFQVFAGPGPAAKYDGWVLVE